jgi:hypothetical protein
MQPADQNQTSFTEYLRQLPFQRKARQLLRNIDEEPDRCAFPSLSLSPLAWH